LPGRHAPQHGIFEAWNFHRLEVSIVMADTPKVSIGLPVYNGEGHIRAALDNLLSQSEPDLEIVISDNGSTDGTEAICREYAARDGRVRYARSDRNRGVAWNFNQVFHLARGRYFKWASSNDIHDPDYVRECLSRLEANDSAVLVYGKTKLIDERGAVTAEYEDNLDLPWPDPPRRFREYLERVGLCNALYGLMRPEAVRRTAILGDYPGSDVVFLGELTLHGTFVEVPRYLLYRRFDRAGEAHNATLESWQEFFAPNTRGTISMRTWRHQFEYFRGALRAPVSLVDKARVVGRIARICIAVRRELARELAGAVRWRFSRRPASTT
jgi:glycosyltransferase involved in cell wall biosynthesis